MPTNSVYAATKAAVHSFARTRTTNLKVRRIRVNAVSRGIFKVSDFEQSDQDVLAAARAFAAAARPLKAEFVKRGMREDFIEDLEANIGAFDEAIARRIESRGSHVESTAAIDDATERGVGALRELDPIMRNILADDPAKLAAWLSASHVERAARRAGKEDVKPTAHGSPSGTPAPPDKG